MSNKTTTYEANVKDLCYKIDTLESKTKYWQEKYQSMLEHAKDLEDRLFLEKEKNTTNMANVLSILENTNESGDVIIPKKDKQIFVEMFKK